MTPLFKLVVSVMFIVAGVLLLLSALTGCSGIAQMSDRWCDAHPGAPVTRCWGNEQSWDQANLKHHDAGCPTAIFITPGGNLEQCP